MQLTSLAFLFGFFPIVLGLYQLLLHFHVRPKWRNLFLVAASLLFYAFGSLKSLFVLVFILLWNWTCAGWIAGQQKNLAVESESDSAWEAPDSSLPQAGMQGRFFTGTRDVLILCIGVNLLLLFLYKYMDSWLGGLAGLFHQPDLLLALVMPVGLSFYVFSSLSYVLDVYRQKAAACSLVDFALFAAFFARVNMGPIGHYARFCDQLDNHPATPSRRKSGSALFFQGLAYKVILADNFAAVFQGLNANTSWLGNLLCGFAYFFELYFDFAGYSRMARGVSLWFGFVIPPNFNKPYQALSVQDFWRRWHISLTDWFRDYVYIPLGGNRVSASRWILNILIVWLLTGLWHGSTLPFLFWGLWQAFLILAEKFWLGNILKRIPAFFQHAWVVISQLLGWTLFFSQDIAGAFGRIGRYFGAGISGLANQEAGFWLVQSMILFVLGILCCSSVFENTSSLFQKSRLKKQVLGAAGYGLLFLVCLALLISQTSQTFLYAVF